MDLESSGLGKSVAAISENVNKNEDSIQETKEITQTKKNKLRVSLKPNNDEVEDRVNLEENTLKDKLLESVVDVRASSQQVSHIVAEEDFKVLNLGDAVSFFSTSEVNGFLSVEGVSQPSCSLQISNSSKAPKNFGKSIADDLKLWIKERNKEMQGTILYCDVCQGELEAFYYHSDKQGSLNLCKVCYSDENFATGMYHSDFEKILLNKRKQFGKLGDIVTYGKCVQLKHRMSGRFLAVNPGSDSLGSQDKAITMKLSLEKNPTEDTWFTILPKYKVQFVGEKILIGDEILLVSAKWQRFLHVNSLSIFEHHEVNASYEQTGWKLLSFVNFSDIVEGEPASNLVRGGSLIRLLHLEVEATFCYDYIDWDSKAPTNNKRFPFLRPTKKAQDKISDAHSIFQIILDSAYNGGEALTWSTNFKLYHVASGRYLAVKTKYVPPGAPDDQKYLTYFTDDHIVSDSPDSDKKTLFQFRPIKKGQSNNIQLNSKVQLFHVKTESWLSAKSEFKFAKNSAAAKVLSSHPIDAGFITKRLSQDVMRVLPVKFSDITNLAQVQETGSILEEFAKQLDGRNQIHRRSAKSILNLLKRTCQSESNPIRSRQLLYRSLQVIEKLFSIIQIPYNLKTIDKIPYYNKICLYSYRLLGCIVKDYPKNSLAVAENLPFLASQLPVTQSSDDPIAIEMVNLLKEIFHDNRYLVKLRDMTEKFLDKVCRLVFATKNILYVSLLASLCVSSNQKGIQSNQDFIHSVLLEGREKKENLLYPIRFAESKVGAKSVEISVDESAWQPFLIFTSDITDMNYRFYNEMLALCSNLCAGRNYGATRTIRTEMSIDLVFFCITDNRLPEQMRVNFAQILLHAYLDSAPQDYVELLNHSRIWSDLKGSPTKQDKNLPSITITNANEYPTIDLDPDPSSGKMELIPKEKKRVLNTSENVKYYGLYGTIEENLEMWAKVKDFIREELDRRFNSNSIFTLTLLRILRLFISFNLSLSEEDISKLYFTLYKQVKSGSEESKKELESKVAKNQENKQMYVVTNETEIYETRGTFQKLNDAKEVSLTEIPETKETGVKDNPMALSIYFELCELLNMLHDKVLDQKVTTVLRIFKDYNKSTKEQVPNLNSLLDQTIKALQSKYLSSRVLLNAIDFNAESEPLDLIYLTQLPNIKLNIATFRLIVRQYLQKEEVKSIVANLRLMMFDDEVNVYLKAKRIKEEISKALATGVRNEYRKHKLLPFIEDLVNLCQSQTKRYANQPNKRNQDLLAHLRIQNKVLEVIVKIDKTSGDMSHSDRDDELVKVVEACYNFLQQWCKFNPINQQFLWQEKELFFKHAAIGLDFAVELLCTMVQSNFKIASVMTEKECKQLIELIQVNGFKPIYLKFFKFLLNIKMRRGRALSELQTLILRLLLENPNTILLYNSQEEKLIRAGLLEREEDQLQSYLTSSGILHMSTEAASRTLNSLLYHVELLTLLALCAENNYPAQVMVKGLLSFEDLVTHICDCKLPMMMKTAYYRILTSVFTTAENPNEKTILQTKPFSSTLLIRLMESMIIDLNNITSSIAKDIGYTQSEFLFEGCLEFTRSLFSTHHTFLRKILGKLRHRSQKLQAVSLSVIDSCINIFKRKHLPQSKKDIAKQTLIKVWSVVKDTVIHHTLGIEKLNDENMKQAKDLEEYVRSQITSKDASSDQVDTHVQRICSLFDIQTDHNVENNSQMTLANSRSGSGSATRTSMALQPGTMDSLLRTSQSIGGGKDDITKKSDLPFNCKEDALKKELSVFGKVRNVHLSSNAVNRTCSAIVEFENEQCVDKALLRSDMEDGIDFKGTKISVFPVQPEDLQETETRAMHQKLTKFMKKLTSAVDNSESLVAILAKNTKDMDYSVYVHRLFKILCDTDLLYSSNTQTEGTVVLFLDILNKVLREEYNWDDTSVEKIVDTAMKMVVIIISSYTSVPSSVFRSRILYFALRVATQLLKQHTVLAQTRLRTHLIEEKDHSSLFFKNIYDIIGNFASEMKRSQVVQSDSNNDSDSSGSSDSNGNSALITKQLFRVLQLLCEGNHHQLDTINRQLQDMLREQAEDTSYNILTMTLDYLILLERKLNLPSSTMKHFSSWQNKVGKGINTDQPSKEISQEDVKQEWAFVDKDKSGTLNMEEVTLILTRLNLKFDSDKMSECFKDKEVDKDGSGELNFEEFIMFLRKLNVKFIEDSGGQAIMSKANIELANQIVKTLNEYILGPNDLNQKSLFDTNHLFGPINSVLAVDLEQLIFLANYDPLVFQSILDLMTNVVGFLLSFFEGEINPTYAQTAIANINLDQLMSIMLTVEKCSKLTGSVAKFSSLHNSYEEINITRKTREVVIDFGKSCFILIRRLMDAEERVGTEYTVWNKFEGNGKDKQYQELATLFNANRIGSIEIVRNDKLERILFKIPKMCIDLWEKAEIEKLKDELAYTVNRENQYEKIEDFFDKAEDLMSIMKYRWKGTFDIIKSEESIESEAQEAPEMIFQEKATIWPVFVMLSFKFTDLFENICLFLSIVINILLFASVVSGDDNYDFRSKIWQYVIYAFSILLCICSTMRLIGFFVTGAPIFVEQKIRHSRKKKLSKQQTAGKKSDKEEVLFGSVNDVWSRNALRYYARFMTTGEAFFVVVYTILCYVGIAYPLVFCFHLFDLLLRFFVLKNFLSLLAKNWQILVQTGLLTMIILWVYAILAFSVFSSEYEETFEGYCTTLYGCYLLHLNRGLQGAVVSSLNSPDFPSKIWFGRWAFDLTFYFLITVILIAVISGIIIDQFGAIRDVDTTIKEDMKSNCFVCSIDSGKFERHANGFINHITKEHNMWHYLFFMIYLDQTDPSEYSAQEDYVAAMMKERDLSFFPIERALSLPQSIIDKEETAKQDEE